MNRFVSLLARLGARQLVAMALMVLVGWCSATQYFVMTPEGRQCPTAAVQTISVPVKSHCGHVVGFETRKPAPGETGFHQCRCAENKAGVLQDLLTGLSAAVAPQPAPVLLLPFPPPQQGISDSLPTKLVSEPRLPEVRPPAAA